MRSTRLPLFEMMYALIYVYRPESSIFDQCILQHAVICTALMHNHFLWIDYLIFIICT